MQSCLEWLGEDSHYFNLHAVLPVADNCTRDDVTRALSLVVGRHEVLRTKFVQRDGETYQKVIAGGALTLRAFDTEPPGQAGGSPPKDSADLILAGLVSVPFDLAEEWPLRCALVTVRGTPRYLAVVLSHQAVDGTGFEVCTAEISAAMVSPAEMTGPGASTAPLWHPVDQALRERGPYGDRANARAVSYWRSQLAKAPAPLFPTCGTPPAEPRIWRIALVSPAIAAGCLRLARTSGTTTASVMLAATAALLSRFTGHDQVSVTLASGNRFDAQTRDCVAMMTQDALMVLAVGGATFTQIIKRASSASLRAYFAGQYDPMLIRQVRTEVARERGLADIDISAYFNNHSPGPDWAKTVPQDLTRQELTGLRARSVARTVSAWPRQDSTLFIHSFYGRGLIVVQAVADTAAFPLTAARAFLQAMEELIVRAAFESMSPGDIDAVAREHQIFGQASPAHGRPAPLPAASAPPRRWGAP